MTEKITLEQRDAVLHILRNPHGWSEDAVLDVRRRCAAELERLWRLERAVQRIAGDLMGTVGDGTA